jgi:serine/threonine-protein kinase
MTGDRWPRLEAIFHAALARPAADWTVFVRAEAGADDGLAADVLALLDAHQTRSPLLDAPVIGALPAGMRLGPYAIDRLLGSGGMATVYLAHRADRQFDKQVAVKLVNHGLAAALTGDRFELERRILARLEHPNVARLLDAGLSEFGQPYLVMEWVDGVPLDEWRRAAAPTLEAALDLWLDVASAVAYAHRNLVVHRDLKPSNVLVTADGMPKLVDFGIAKLLGDAPGVLATKTQHFTPLYASPEQLRGEAVSTSTDVFGLGVLLAELVSGAPPFGGPDRPPHEQARAVLEDEPAIEASVPGDVAAIARMALRKEPERRYASADQMADDVRRYLRGWPVTARPESWSYRARRFIGRNRIATGLVAGSAVALIGATGVALRQARAAEDQRARAEQVTGFLTGFLGATASGPNWALQNRGVSLRVVELADLMSERIGSEFANQPEAEATLRSVLAMSYFQMGELARAREHAERALGLYDGLYAKDDARRMAVEFVQGAVEINLGEFARAERRLLEASARWPVLSAPDRAALATQLGTAQLRLGKLDDAEATLKGGIGAVERDAGPAHPSLALLTSNLSLVYQDRGRFTEAAHWLERAAAISRASFKDASVPLGWALVNLANVYRFQGDVDRSLAAATESLAQFEAALGPTHFSTIHPLAAIAYAKAARGDADAESFIRRGLANQAALPEDHYERAVGLNYLGYVLMKARRLTEARAALESALATRRRVFAAPNWRIAETAGWLGETLVLQGQRDAARALLEESAATFATLYGPDNVRTREARGRLALLSGDAASR